MFLHLIALLVTLSQCTHTIIIVENTTIFGTAERTFGSTVTMSGSVAFGGSWPAMQTPANRVGGLFGISVVPTTYSAKVREAVAQTVAKGNGAESRVASLLGDANACSASAGFGYHTSAGRKAAFVVPVHCGGKNLIKNLPISLGTYATKKSPVDSTFQPCRLSLSAGTQTVQLADTAMSTGNAVQDVNAVSLGADFPAGTPTSGAVLFRTFMVHGADLAGKVVAAGLASADPADELVKHDALLSYYDGRTCDDGARLLDVGPLANHLLLPKLPQTCALAVAADDLAACTTGGDTAGCAAAVQAACEKGVSTAPDAGKCPDAQADKVEAIVGKAAAVAPAPATTAAPLQLLDAPIEVEQADLAEDALEEEEKLPAFIPWTRRSSKLYRLAISTLISSILCLIYEIVLFLSRRYLGCPAPDADEEEEEDLDEIVITSKGKKMTRREAKERAARKAAKREAKRRKAELLDVEANETGILTGLRRRPAD